MRLELLCLLTNVLLLRFVSGSQSDQMVLSSPNVGSEPSSPDVFLPVKHSQPSLQDLLTIETSLSIFFSYAREIEASGLFANETAMTTLLVPTNKAVMALSRKP
jgi:hypothetical protein